MLSAIVASQRVKLAHRSSKYNWMIVKEDASEGFLGGIFIDFV